MNNGMDRRLRRLEVGMSPALPWGRDANEWTDEQLMAVIGATGPLTDAELAEIVVCGGVGDKIILGQREAPSVEAWIAKHAPARE